MEEHQTVAQIDMALAAARVVVALVMASDLMVAQEIRLLLLHLKVTMAVTEFKHLSHTPLALVVAH
jgi:hypothetical protein